MNGLPVAVVVESLGWALLHFLWQGALVAATLYGVLALARNASASLRYLMACAGLSVASIAMVLTFAWQFDRAERRAKPHESDPNHPVAEELAGADSPGSAPADRAWLEPRAADAEADRCDLRAHPFAAWPDRLRDWLPTVVGLWAAGVGLLSLRLFAGWRVIRQMRARAGEIDDPVWIERFAQLRARLGVSGRVRLLASASATVPFVVGWLRPVVLVPAALLTGLHPAEVEAIFAHELAHIRRHDFLVNLLQNVVETLLFYHPAVWWMSAQIRMEREHCCDDVAAAVCGGALDYARALVALERLRPATGLMVAASGGSLLERIRRLAGARDNGRSAWPLPALGLFLAAAIALAAAGDASHGEQKEEHRLPMTFAGSEIIARVGPEVILASDLLPDTNRHLEKVLQRAPSPPPADEIERARRLYMSKFLEHVIETKLVVVEARRNLPKEAWGKIEKQFNEQFDKEYLPKMIDSEECRSRTELDVKLRKSGSSLEALRRQAFENNFAQHWLNEKIQDDHEITDEEMDAYYRAHLADYTTSARARWQHLMARTDKFDSKEEARQAIASWGREVQTGAAFEQVAEAHSQDPCASDGGMHTWTEKGTLVSKVLDEALFSLPIGQLSEILQDNRGFHIIRVIERNEATVEPFDVVHANVRNRIYYERVGPMRQQYKAKLRKTIPIWNIFEDAAGEGKPGAADESANPADDATTLLAADETTKDETDAAEEPAAEPIRRRIMISVVDAATRQPIPRFRVLAGLNGEIGVSEEVKKRHPGLKFPRWLPATLREGENGTLVWPMLPYDQIALRVEADGYQPQASARLQPMTPPATLEFALVADAGVTGQILQPDGRPAKGATLAIGMGGRIINVTDGQIQRENDHWPENERDRWRRSGRTETDAEGNFRLPTETDPGAAVLIVHESGALSMSFADIRNQPRVTLKRWGRVAGQVLWKDQVGADQPVHAGTVRQYEYGNPGAIVASANTRSDAQGNFVLDKVLPGRVGVSGGIDLSNPPGSLGMSPLNFDPGRSGTSSLNFDRQTVEVDSDGEPTVLLIGGRGRTVAGRLTGRDRWEGVTLKYLPKVPDSLAFAGAGVNFAVGDRREIGRLYGLWEHSAIGPLYFRGELAPNADGSFEIRHVLPGDYLLFISAADATNYVGGAEFSVEHEQPGQAPPPIDLGEIKVNLAAKAVIQLKEGELFRGEIGENPREPRRDAPTERRNREK